MFRIYKYILVFSKSFFILCVKTFDILFGLKA